MQDVMLIWMYIGVTLTAVIGTFATMASVYHTADKKARNVYKRGQMRRLHNGGKNAR